MQLGRSKKARHEQLPADRSTHEADTQEQIENSSGFLAKAARSRDARPRHGTRDYRPQTPGNPVSCFLKSPTYKTVMQTPYATYSQLSRVPACSMPHAKHVAGV